jgi:hypothetical protein
MALHCGISLVEGVHGHILRPSILFARHATNVAGKISYFFPYFPSRRSDTSELILCAPTSEFVQQAQLFLSPI